MQVDAVKVALIVLEGVGEKPVWLSILSGSDSQGFDNIEYSEHNCGLLEFFGFNY